jgi:hypothetical protein
MFFKNLRENNYIININTNKKSKKTKDTINLALNV